MSRIKGAVKRFEDKGEFTRIGFVDEAALRLSEQFFRDTGFFTFCFTSSFSDASRKFLTIGTFYDDEIQFAYLRLSCDKFHSPSHRDYMGALMGLGIDRKMFGDLIVTANSTAYLVVWDKGDIVEYLSSEFTSSGRAKLRLDRVEAQVLEALEMQYVPIEVIVTSLRADCVVSSIANFSRSQSKAFIESGDFKLFSNPSLEPDRILSCGDVFSVKGFGKYRFDEILGQTRRERIKIKLLKYGNYIERE